MIETGVYLVVAGVFAWGIRRSIQGEKEAGFDLTVAEARRELKSTPGKRIYLTKDALAPTIIPAGSGLELATLSVVDGLQQSREPIQE